MVIDVGRVSSLNGRILMMCFSLVLILVGLALWVVHLWQWMAHRL